MELTFPYVGRLQHSVLVKNVYRTCIGKPKYCTDRLFMEVYKWADPLQIDWKGLCEEATQVKRLIDSGNNQLHSGAFVKIVDAAYLT